MFPNDVLASIASQHPLGLKTQPPMPEPKRQPFPAWNVIDDAKKEASREFEVASQKAQAKTGAIEPWSGKYYAACTFGGLLACVCFFILYMRTG